MELLSTALEKGNTGPSLQPNNDVKNKTAQSTKYRNWLVTWNNITTAQEQVFLKKMKRNKYIYQMEIGESGTRHLQGGIILKDGKTVSAMRKYLKGSHVEIAIEMDDVIDYSQKIDTRAGPIKYQGIRPNETIIDYIVYPLPKWQNDVIEMCKQEPDRRKVNWIVDRVGGCGKTTLVRHLLLTRPDVCVVGGNRGDCLYVVNEFLKEHIMRVLVVDVPKSAHEHVSYNAIEQVKGGLIVSTKYESAGKVINPCHVFVFANFEPDYNEFIQDRWNVIDLNKPPAATASGSKKRKIANLLFSN